jgi:ComF family protein
MATGRLRRVGLKVLDLVFPRACHSCKSPLRGEENPSFCPDCWGTIKRIDGPACPSCGIPFASRAALSHSPAHRCGDCRMRPPRFDRAVAAGLYEGVLAEAIQLFKYRGRAGLARPLGELLAEAAGSFPAADGLVPVPLHPGRLRERGYNQALLLCDVLARRLGVEVIPDGLERRRETPPQTGLSPEARRRNVRRAFEMKPRRRMKGRRIILVDDVLTTGATVNECARVLKRAGARAVYVLTVARAVPS